MPTRLVVNEQNSLLQEQVNERPPQPMALRIPARLFSILFHPVFIPLYVIAFLIKVVPYLFAGFTEGEKVMVMIRFAVLYIMFPLVTVLLLKALGFIQSFQLKTQRDRIIPYVICMIYYFWVWYVIKNQPEFPQPVVQFTLAVFISSIIGLMSNTWFKISMHAMALGIALVFVASLGFTQDLNIGYYLSIAVFITGLVLTSRFIDSDHSEKEIYLGLLAGMAAQLAALWIA